MYYMATSKKQITIGVILVTIILAALANWFKFTADDAIANATKNEIVKIVEQLNSNLENHIEEGIEDLSSISSFATKFNISNETAVEFLNSQSQVSEFSNVYYIDLLGNGISNSGKVNDFSNDEVFINSLANEFYLSNPYLHENNHDIIFRIGVPIKENNDIIAVLIGEINIENFTNSLSNSINPSSDFFIVDTNLNLIFSTSENHINQSTIPKKDSEAMGYANLVAAQNNVSNNIDNSFYYDYYGVSKLMVYSNIDNTNLALALNANVDEMNIELSNAVQKLEYISIGIYWFLILVLAYTAVNQSRSLKLLENAAYYDALTGLPNQLKLANDMSVILKKNKNKSYAIMKFDVENFKVINEIFGFDIGDKVITAPKYIIKEANEPTAIIARVGTDEHLVFVSREFLSTIDETASFYESFYKKLIPELENYNLSFKYGRYNIPIGETDVSEIINKVILAHNMAKSNKNTVVYDYDEEYRNKLLSDALLTRNMKPALENNEFKVFLQPKFSVKEDKLIGAEALVRWIEDDGTMIFPNDFIPLFEKNGFIVDLDKYIIENVCILLRRWIDKGFDALSVSVNCSRLNLENPNFAKEIADIANQHNIPCEYLEIELTESAAIENEEIIESFFKTLHDFGFKISIDDFGSGYSSLGLLKDMQVDTLKLDRSFFFQKEEGTRSEHVINSIIKMAHGLGMYVVAEGIETLQQVELLKNSNCDAIQGYFYSKPLPVNEFEDKYLNN